ncbi:tetratricopeptide repeat protein, partial [Xanthomonas campestris pv. campestris]
KPATTQYPSTPGFISNHWYGRWGQVNLNPGYIKWFVSAVQSGQAPEAVLQNSHLFLEFCMSNVYKFLSQDAREITATMQCEPGGKDLPELHFLSGMEAIRIQKALQELLTTNMLSESSKPSGGSIRTTYQLVELARAYLNKHHKPSQVTLKKFRDNRNKLNSMVENNNHGFKNDKYATHNVKVRSKSDQIIFKRLREALQHIKEGSYDIAYEILEECQKLSPEYYEVARIFAFFHQKRGNYTEARENYELAIALAPDTPQLLFWFGKFIMTCEQDLDSAIQKFEAAHKLDSGSPEISVNLARAQMIQHSFDRAHQLLEQCNATASSLSDHLRGMYYDTTVQIHYRQADDFCSSGRTTEAITSLNDMILAFNRLPSDISDQYIRGKLSKANLTVQRLLRSCTDATSSKNLHEISEWLERESRAKSKATRSRT